MKKLSLIGAVAAILLQPATLALAGTISVVSQTSTITGTWDESWWDLKNPELHLNDGPETKGTFAGSPMVDSVTTSSFITPLSGYAVNGDVGPLSVHLYAVGPMGRDFMPTPPEDSGFWSFAYGEIGIHGESVTTFRATMGTLDLSLFNTSFNDPWSGHYGWQATLLDLTTSSLVTHDEWSPGGPAQDPVTKSYTLTVDPTHLYSLSLSGTVRVAYDDASQYIGLDATLRSYGGVPEEPHNSRVPDSSSTFVLLCSGVLGIAAFCRRR